MLGAEALAGVVADRSFLRIRRVRLRVRDAPIGTPRRLRSHRRCLQLVEERAGLSVDCGSTRRLGL